MLTSSHFKEVRREIQCRNAGRQRVINLLFTLFQNRTAAASFKNAAGFALTFHTINFSVKIECTKFYFGYKDSKLIILIAFIMQVFKVIQVQF